MRRIIGLLLLLTTLNVGRAAGAKPTLVITAPAANADTGPSVTLQFVSTFKGQQTFRCSLDGGTAQPCSSGAVFTLTDGAHSLRVDRIVGKKPQAHESATVSFTADALAPVIDDVEIEKGAAGTVDITFSVSDLSSAVASIECSLNSGAFVSCGTGGAGAVTYTELTPGGNQVDIRAADTWGNSNTDGHPFSASLGAGHLVLIGHDYEPVSETPDTQLTQLLLNAFNQTAAVGFARAQKVALIAEESTTGELSQIEAILDGAGIDVDDRSLDSLTTAIAGADVLLITDQNGEVDEETASSAEPGLRSFLEAGGVVVVLDGVFDTGDGDGPSDNYRVLAPALLEILDADEFIGESVAIPCNVDDPLATDLPTSFIVNQKSVRFVTPEPWITFSNSDELSDDRAVVLHRWFGTAPEGPVALRIGGFSPNPDSPNSDLSGFDAIFQDAAGAEVRSCVTLTNGTAVTHMQPSGFASFGNTVGDSSTLLVSFVGAQPLDLLEFPNGQGFPETTPIDVELPGTFGGAALYRVVGGCVDQTADAPPTLVNVACPNPDGTFNLVAEAIDEDGEILAYTMLNSVEIGTTATFPLWKLPNLVASIERGALDPTDVSLRVGLGAGEVAFDEGTGPVHRAAAEEASFSFYSDPGVGVNAFDQLSYAATATSEGPPAPEYDSVIGRNERGGLLSALTIDLGSDLLPPLTELTFDFDDGVAQTSWTAAGDLDTIDGGNLFLAWLGEGTTHLWLVVFPPGTSVTTPPAPIGPTSLYWPSDEDSDSIALSQLRLDATDFFDSYDEYRQGGFVFSGLPAGPSSWLFTRLDLTFVP